MFIQWSGDSGFVSKQHLDCMPLPCSIPLGRLVWLLRTEFKCFAAIECADLDSHDVATGCADCLNCWQLQFAVSHQGNSAGRIGKQERPMKVAWPCCGTSCLNAGRNGDEATRSTRPDDAENSLPPLRLTRFYIPGLRLWLVSPLAAKDFTRNVDPQHGVCGAG